MKKPGFSRTQHWRGLHKSRLYKRAPSRCLEDFKLWIFEFENSRPERANLRDKISMSDAAEIFSDLRLKPKHAAKNECPHGIIVVYCRITETWRGIKTPTPDSTLNIVRDTPRHEQLKDTHKQRMGYMKPCSREDVIQMICCVYKCDDEAAERNHS
jgi:hypothetical protein